VILVKSAIVGYRIPLTRFEIVDDEIEKNDATAADDAIGTTEIESEAHKDLSDVLLALQRYETVMAHLRYDQEMFWERFGFMLLSEVAVLGFFFGIVGNDMNPADMLGNQIIAGALLGMPVVGASIIVLFFILSRISSAYVNRWIDTLKTLEPLAFDEIVLFGKKAHAWSARFVAYIFMALLLVAWVLLFAAVGNRYFGWTLSHIVPTSF